MTEPVEQSNGWLLYGHLLFIERLEELVELVVTLQQKDPMAFHRHVATKLLVCVRRCIFKEVPNDPSADCYRLGKTLGLKNTHWRRVKALMPPRYRLFFLFKTQAPKTIIYAWFNDESTLRQEGAKTDVYTVFQRLLAAGKVPSSFSDLHAEARALDVKTA